MSKIPDTHIDEHNKKSRIFEHGIAICRERLEDMEGEAIVDPGDIVKYYTWYDEYEDIVRCMVQTKGDGSWNGKKVVMDEGHFFGFFRVFVFNQRRFIGQR